MLAIRGTGPARSRAVLAAGIVATGIVAGCAYEPSSFSFLSRPSRVVSASATIGCLDLAITPRAPLLGERSSVLAFEFGNRCDHPTIVDLASMSVVGRAADGRMYALAAYDPLREIRAAQLDGRDRARELIAYPTEVELADVCVDAAAIARQTPPQWLCVTTSAPLRGNHLIAEQGGS